jgi:oligosaccharide repeat unit polymerase
VRDFVRLNRTVLSPLVAFCLAWVFTALLSQVHLLNGQTAWSTVVVAAVVAVPLAFLAGGLIGEGIAVRVSRPGPKELTESSTRVFRIVLVVFLVLGLAELAHQFVKIGGIPLLSPNGNVIRFNQGGPTIVLTDLLTVAAVAALVKPENLLARESRFELVVTLIALGGFALQAGRGSVILPVIVATAGRWLYWGRPKAWMFSGAALIAFAAIVFGFYLRTRQNPYNPFEAELFGEIVPGTPVILQPLIPIYLALTTNFLALQGIVGHYPTVAPFGHGVFDSLALNAVIPSAQNLSDVSAALTPPWVTSTVAGPFWADGGFWVLIPGVAITGLISAGAFAMAVRTRSLRWSMAAAYLLYLVLFGLYSNLWTQSVDWVLIVPLLLIVGAIVEDSSSPPGLTGRVWTRIRPVIAKSQTEPGPAAAPQPAPEGSKRGLSRSLIAIGAGALLVLLVSGLLIQRLLPEPYPLVASIQLPATVANAREAMTDSDLPLDNQPLYWVNTRGTVAELSSFEPRGNSGTAQPPRRIQVPGLGADTSFDVGAWPPWRNLALYSFTQRKGDLKIEISPQRTSEGRTQTLYAPVAKPDDGAVNQFMIATWGGDKPDLFVLTRGSSRSRAEIRVLTGESGFQRQALVNPLPFRGLGPGEWSADIAQLASIADNDEQRVVPGDKPDLLLVHHEPGREHSSVEVLLGESGFVWDAFQRDLDTPGNVPAGTEFMLGSRLGAATVYEVRRHESQGPRLRMFGLQNPPQFR